MTVAHQAPCPLDFPGGLPFPAPGDLSHPGIKPASPALAGRFFTTEPLKTQLQNKFLFPTPLLLNLSAENCLILENASFLSLHATNLRLP